MFVGGGETTHLSEGKSSHQEAADNKIRSINFQKVRIMSILCVFNCFWETVGVFHVMTATCKTDVLGLFWFLENH